MYFQSIKSVKYNAAMSVNRSILKKSRHIGIGLLKCNLSTVWSKGVGPSTTLAWPGWKQPDIAVEVDLARLYTSRFKKSCVNCELLYTDRMKELPGYHVHAELSIWEFPFLRGPVGRGGFLCLVLL